MTELKNLFDDSFWKNGPKPGQIYNFPMKTVPTVDPASHSL